MKTITVIDLLNKIANGEEVPKKFIYNSYLWEYDEEEKMWYFHYKVNIYHRFDSYYRLIDILNDEVEIIEDTPREIYFDEEDIKAEKEEMKKLSVEKKDNFYDYYKEDKKIEKLGAFNIKKFYDDYPETAQFILAMFNKQEELIEKVNGE